MSKNDLIALTRVSTSVDCAITVIPPLPATNDSEIVTVDLLSNRNALLFAGALNHMRNVSAWVDDNRVIIPLDETGYTRRYNSTLPEPDVVRY